MSHGHVSSMSPGFMDSRNINKQLYLRFNIRIEGHNISPDVVAVVVHLKKIYIAITNVNNGSENGKDFKVRVFLERAPHGRIDMGQLQNRQIERHKIEIPLCPETYASC